ncbi:MAG: acyltransferase [Verrucomicrobiota bacterium]|nr:acyltransferase [Verrucomicrobiota bacterium]
MATNIRPDRTVEDDWWTKPIPDNVTWGDGFYCETAQVFRFLKSTCTPAVTLGSFVSCYAGCSFAIGKNGTVQVGDYTLLNGALLMAEENITIGKHCLISWSVAICDSDFHPIDPALRRLDTMALNPYAPKLDRPPIGTKPVVIGDNVWVGFNAVILKGVSIGENSVIAAGTVVTKDVPANVIFAGNPGKIVREIEVKE